LKAQAKSLTHIKRIPAFKTSRGWIPATLSAATLITVVDAVLLERSKGFFRGGFLAVDYLQGPGQTVLFLLVSILIDAAVIGFVTAVVAWLLGRTRLHARACTLAGVLLVTGAILEYEVVSYEIVRYLGDAFDLSLMFDLSGRRVDEILAVSSSYLVAPIVGSIAGLAIIGGIVWVAHRYSSTASDSPIVFRMLLLPVLTLAAGLVTLTAATTTSDTFENGLLRKPSARLLAFLVNAMTDVDRDGFGVVGRMSDPSPFDASVFPYAIEVPGNGRDEDGVGGDLPPDAARYVEPVVPSALWRRRPDVVLVVLESFRADLVGGRLNGKSITPVLDALTAQGVSVPAAFSINGYTVQSRYHLLSGHLARLSDGKTLIDDFKANGYLVAYFSGQDESFGGAQYDIGFGRADVSYDARVDPAQRYTTTTTPGSLAVPLAVVERRIDEFLDARGSDDRPLFLYVNFHDTHFPYWHEGIEPLLSPDHLSRDAIVPEAKDALWATYANTAANVDRAVGHVLDAVRRRRGTQPGVIVTGDHGESLFDEGFLGHGYALDDVQSRVPLVVANLPMQLPNPFAQIDLRASIGKALGADPDAPATPVVRTENDRVLFQYLGDLSRPRQIAFYRQGARVIFDFRSQRVQFPEAGWVGMNAVTPSQQEEFERLIRQWEWLNLAERTR
jgi:Sulfatase